MFHNTISNLSQIENNPCWRRTMYPLRQAIWRHIWKFIVEKSPTNVVTVILHVLMQALWGHIWKRTVEKSQTNANNVTMRPPKQTVRGDPQCWKVKKKFLFQHILSSAAGNGREGRYWKIQPPPLGWFLFSKISEFPIVHVPKLFPLLHRFQNYFCFCSRTFPSHGGSFFSTTMEISMGKWTK